MNFLGAREDHATALRQGNRFPKAIKQFHLERILQRHDLRTDRRLSQMQFVCRTGNDLYSFLSGDEKVFISQRLSQEFIVFIELTKATP